MAHPALLKVGVAGMGGYARLIADLILDEADADPGHMTLAAVCDPELARHDGRAGFLRSRDVAIYESYERMLADGDLDAVWLPVPIHLHLPFALKAMASGLGVMIEKPAAGTVDEVDAMIQARDVAGVPVAVGFQDIYEPTTLKLKRELLAGDFGSLRQATLWASWPRTDSYFSRSSWTGRLRAEGKWVLDSPANNALAHFVNLAMFLLGPTEAESATPLWVEAETYRAADIENYDTISARVGLPDGVELLIMLTHASAEEWSPCIRVEADRGEVEWTQRAIVARRGDRESIIERGSPRQDMVHRFASLLSNEPAGERAVATLEVARMHSLLVSAISEAASVVQVPADCIRTRELEHGAVRTICGIESVMRHCANHNMMFHESGLLPFSVRPTRRDLTGYRRFKGPNLEPVVKLAHAQPRRTAGRD